MNLEKHLQILYFIGIAIEISLILVLICLGLGFNKKQSEIIDLRKDVMRLSNVQDRFITNAERYKLYDREYVMNNRVRGVYYSDIDTYCVWLSNETIEDIDEADCHEYMHFLIDEGDCRQNNKTITCREHFCKDKKVAEQ